MGKIKESQTFLKHLSFNLSNSQKKVPLSLDSARGVLLFLVNRAFSLQKSLPHKILFPKNTMENAPFFLGLHFVGKKKISSIHQSLFNDPSPTDCITVPYHDPVCLGEVFVCPEVALDFSKKEKIDVYEEMTLYTVHGFLHLCGYEDETEKKRALMKKEEKTWMLALAEKRLLITR